MAEKFENLVEIYRGHTIDIFYHTSNDYIEIFYKGGISKSEEFREACFSALEYAATHQIKKWYIDQREMNIHPNDQKWFFEEWQPKMDAAVPEGRKTAIILSKNLFTEFSIKMENRKLLDELPEEKMRVEFFQEKEPALDWLLN